MTYAVGGPDRPGTGAPSAARRGLGCLFELAETVVLTIVIYLLIHTFVAQPFQVEQSSMVSTIEPGDYVLIDKLTPRFNDFERGDIVVFQPPSGFSTTDVPFIKRVIGLPGDTVTLDNGHVYVTPPGGTRERLDEPYVIQGPDGNPAPTLPRDPAGTTSWVVPEGRYFVMGDNRPDSQDSRFFGPIARDAIVGRAFMRYFPVDQLGIFQRPVYPGLGPLGRVYGLGGSSAMIHGSMARS